MTMPSASNRSAKKFLFFAPTFAIHALLENRWKATATSIASPTYKCNISQSCFGKPNTVCGPMPFTKEHFIIKPVPVKKQKHRKSSVSTILLSTNTMELFCILIALIQEQSSGFNAKSKYTRMLELKMPKAVIWLLMIAKKTILDKGQTSTFRQEKGWALKVKFTCNLVGYKKIHAFNLVMRHTWKNINSYQLKCH